MSIHKPNPASWHAHPVELPEAPCNERTWHPEGVDCHSMAYYCVADSDRGTAFSWTAARTPEHCLVVEWAGYGLGRAPSVASGRTWCVSELPSHPRDDMDAISQAASRRPIKCATHRKRIRSALGRLPRC